MKVVHFFPTTITLSLAIKKAAAEVRFVQQKNPFKYIYLSIYSTFSVHVVSLHLLVTIPLCIPYISYFEECKSIPTPMDINCTSH